MPDSSNDDINENKNQENESSRNQSTAQPQDRSTAQPPNRSTAQPQNRPTEDVWEEEIDLRKVGRGIIDKWKIWVGIPLFIMIIVGGYYAQPTPDKYLLSGSVIVDYDQPDLKKLDISIPPREVIYDDLRSANLLRPHYKEYFNPDPDKDIEATMASTLASIEFETDTQAQPVPIRLTVKTTKPDSMAPALTGLLRDFKEQEYQRVRELVEDRLQSYQSRQTYLEDNWDQWYPEWKKIVADTFPDFLEPKLKAARTDYDTAARKISEVKSQYKVARAKLEEINNILKNEPKHYGYRRSPYFPMSFQGEGTSITKNILNSLKNKPSEIMNQAYLDLRQQRVSLSEKVSALKARKQNLGQQLNKIDTAVELIETLPELERKKETLKSQQAFLSENMASIEDKITRAQYLMTSLPDFLEIYTPEAPGRLVENQTNAGRNTLLAGAVTFLLLFFGVAFWEIL